MQKTRPNTSTVGTDHVWYHTSTVGIDTFDYFDKSVIVLSVTCDSFSVASFATVTGAYKKK